MQTSRGLSLVEGVVAVAIVAASLVALIGGFGRLLAVALRAEEDLKAHYLALEGFEAVRLVRDDGWDAYIAPLSIGASYHFLQSGNIWTLTATPQDIDGFTRTAVFGNVNRDGDGRIAESGTADSNTRLVTVAVSWQGADGVNTRLVSGYITNFLQ